jgi:hypothetical protein
MQMDKKYHLAGLPHEYTMLSTDGGGNYPIIGMIKEKPNGEAFLCRHTKEGKCNWGNKYTLVEVVPKISVDFMVNIYHHELGGYYGVMHTNCTPNRALELVAETKSKNAVASVPVTIEFVKGQGLPVIP